MKGISKLREIFPITQHKVYLNHAAHSPLPRPVRDAMEKQIAHYSQYGDFSEFDDGKASFAKLVNAKVDEVALVENTSVGLNMVANMLEYPQGANVVTTDLEYPSVVYPWKRKKLDVTIRYVENREGKILLDDLEKAVDDQTVAVVISHVEYANGFRFDVKAVSEIAHAHGAYLIVDAIQSVGALTVDVKRDDVDFLTAAVYKWMLGPPGIGYLYVRKELIEKFEPPFIGWASVKPEIFETINPWEIRNLTLSETATRFEIGTPSRFSAVGAVAALRILLNVGVPNIEKRILALTDHLIEKLKEKKLKLQTPPELKHRSGIVNFLIDKPEEKVEKLKKKGIIVSARSRGVRVSPHFYNTREEIDKFVEAVTE
ncbi:MAG: aminotransferase class V-fold PLP-dependent enzyme [Candidatus Bathyarchaeales archaeon]